MKHFDPFLIAACCSIPLLAGCMDRVDMMNDALVAQTRSRYVWAVPGERRLARMFLPWYLTLDRDQFRIVRSDGTRFVAALASQSNDTQPHDVYLYMIDGSTGQLRFVIPSISSSVYCVGKEHLVLIGDAAAEGTQAIEVRSVADGRLVLKASISDYLPDRVLHVAIAGNILRLTGPNGRPEAFVELPSGKQLTKDEVDNSPCRPADPAAKDQPRSYWEHDPSYPKEASCGDVLVRIPADCRTWLLATRRQGF